MDVQAQILPHSTFRQSMNAQQLERVISGAINTALQTGQTKPHEVISLLEITKVSLANQVIAISTKGQVSKIVQATFRNGGQG